MPSETTPTSATTTQLRRYVIAEGELDAFVDWWTSRLVPARQSGGFTVEFGYAVPSSSEFVWAVSTPGDEAAFTALQEAYQTSDARNAAFDGVPDRIASVTLSFVTPVA